MLYPQGVGPVQAARILPIFLAWAPAISQQAQSLDGFKLVKVLDLKAVTHHVQGVDFDDQRIWVTSVDTAGRRGHLYEFSAATGELARSVEIQDGDRFHPGGIATDETSIWMPVAEYRRNSTAVIQRRSKSTLDLEFQFAVRDHIGCLAVMPKFLIGGNWDSRQFYIWNHRGELIRTAANPTDNGYQDMKFDSEHLIASGLLPDRTGAIDWIEFPSLRLVRRIRAGKTDRGEPLTREGMAIRGNRVMLLPEDGSSRVFIFDRSQ